MLFFFFCQLFNFSNLQIRWFASKIIIFFSRISSNFRIFSDFFRIFFKSLDFFLFLPYFWTELKFTSQIRYNNLLFWIFIRFPDFSTSPNLKISYFKWTFSMLTKSCFIWNYRYYGLWLWFPELFNRLNIYYENHPNATVGVCDIKSEDLNDDPNKPVDCTVGSAVFLNSFLISLSAAPGNVWTIVQMDKLGRKFFLGKFVRICIKVMF